MCGKPAWTAVRILASYQHASHKAHLYDRYPDLSGTSEHMENTSSAQSGCYGGGRWALRRSSTLIGVALRHPVRICRVE